MNVSRITWGLLFIGLVILVYILFIRPVQATYIPKVDVCHCEQPDSESPFQCQTLNIAIPGAIAHLAEHEADYAGACQEPSPTPSSEPVDVCANLQGVQEQTPEGYVNDDGICYLLEQTAGPSATLVPYTQGGYGDGDGDGLGCAAPGADCSGNVQGNYPTPVAPTTGPGGGCISPYDGKEVGCK